MPTLARTATPHVHVSTPQSLSLLVFYLYFTDLWLYFLHAASADYFEQRPENHPIL